MIRYTIDARGQMVAIYEDGTVVPVLGADSDDPMAAGSGGTGTPAQETGGSADGYAGGTPYARNSGYARTYTPRRPDGDGAWRDPAPPAYADGSQHPAFGGDPRVAGGFAALAQPDRPTGQRQVSVPGGAAAGPYSTRAAFPGSGAGVHGGSAERAGGGGGGSALYNAWRAKLEGHLMPGGSGYDAYDSGYAAPKERKEPMHGPFARGLDPDQALGLALRPTAMIGRAVPGLSATSPRYSNLAQLPAYQLAVLGQRGYKGTPQALANAVGRFYDRAGNDNELPEFDQVYRNLTNPKQGGGIDQMFNGVKAPKGYRQATGYTYEYGQEPLAAADAAGAFERLLGGALSLLPPATAAKYGAYAAHLTDQATLKDMKHPAGKGKDIPRMVGRRLFR